MNCGVSDTSMMLNCAEVLSCSGVLPSLLIVSEFSTQCE